MAEYMFLMHGLTVPDARPDAPHPDWGPYIAGLMAKGVMRGGSAMGRGVCARKSGDAPDISRHLSGYIKIEADSLEAARALLDGNPVYEAGGVVEIRELPVTG